jgi:threonine aldolase
LTLAKGLQSLGFSTNTPETNMVYVEVENPPQWEANLGNNGVQCFATGASHLRLVTHLDVNDADIQHTIDAFNQCQAAG